MTGEDSASAPHIVRNARGRRRRGTRGSEILEFGLTFGPMMGVVFLLTNVSWTVFSRGALQYAVREGVRYAVTSQTKSGLGHVDSIKTVVQSNALGMLRGTAGWNRIQVHFYTPDTFTDVTGVVGGNVGGNLVEVSVEGFTANGVAPSIKLAGMTTTLAAITLSASSWDRMEASPVTGPPPM